MVGVAGSSPVAPTKQNPVLLPVLEGPTERLALFCCLLFSTFGNILGNRWENDFRTAHSGPHLRSYTPPRQGRGQPNSAPSFSHPRGLAGPECNPALGFQLAELGVDAFDEVPHQ